MAHDTDQMDGRSSAKVTSIDAARPRKKAARRSRRKDPVIQKTLDTFCTALTAGDGQACAELWLTPAFFVGDNMLKAVEDRDELANFFASGKQHYLERGITDTRGEIETIEWLTDRLVLVAVRFPYLDDQGAEHGDERSTYTMRKEDDGSYRFCVAIMKGASEPERLVEEEAKTAEDSN